MGRSVSVKFSGGKPGSNFCQPMMHIRTMYPLTRFSHLLSAALRRGKGNGYESDDNDKQSYNKFIHTNTAEMELLPKPV